MMSLPFSLCPSFYIAAMEKLGQSENGKLIIYPADVQQAVKGMLGSVFK